MGQRNAIDRRFLVQVFVPVPLAARYPPGGAVAGEVELGQLVGDPQRLAHARIVEDIAEGDRVVEDAERDAEPALLFAVFLEADGQFLVVIAHEALLAPGLLPGLVMARPGAAGDLQAALQLVLIGQQEAEPAVGQHGLAVPVHAVERAPLAIDVDGDGDRPIGRGDDFFRRGGRGGQEGEGGENGGKSHGSITRAL